MSTGRGLHDESVLGCGINEGRRETILVAGPFWEPPVVHTLRLGVSLSANLWRFS
jgi:hypothetical protein